MKKKNQTYVRNFKKLDYDPEFSFRWLSLSVVIVQNVNDDELRQHGVKFAI
jgi:hypothetical protein